MTNNIQYNDSIYELGTTSRTIRGLIGATAIGAVLTGYVIDPVWLFSLTLASVYFGMTAITALDPFHSMIVAMQDRSAGEGTYVIPETAAKEATDTPVGQDQAPFHYDHDHPKQAA